MRRVGLGYGLIVALLVPIALLLFGILGLRYAIAGILLLSGLWTLVFGLTMKRDGLYYSGFGAIVALLCTFLFTSFAYAAGLIVVAVVVLVLVRALSRA